MNQKYNNIMLAQCAKFTSNSAGYEENKEYYNNNSMIRIKSLQDKTNKFVFLEKQSIWLDIQQYRNLYEFHEVLIHDSPTKMYFDVDMDDDMTLIEELC